MLHRIATSELYRCNPTVVRNGWAFRDYVAAHVILDHADQERKEAEARHGR